MGNWANSCKVLSTLSKPVTVAAVHSEKKIGNIMNFLFISTLLWNVIILVLLLALVQRLIYYRQYLCLCARHSHDHIYVPLQFRPIQYYVNYTVRHRTTSYEDTSFILMLPLHSWWNSIPFLPKTKLWESNIDDFRSIIS